MLFLKRIEKEMMMITRDAVLNYTPRQMFELVGGIENYPYFLPWCRGSQIHHQDEKRVEATLDVAWSGLHKSFTTCNYLYPYERMDIVLIKGPVKHLEGQWHFIPYGERGCKVRLELKVELIGSMVDRVFHPLFQHIANSLVDAFCNRAREIYEKD